MERTSALPAMAMHASKLSSARSAPPPRKAGGGAGGVDSNGELYKILEANDKLIRDLTKSKAVADDKAAASAAELDALREQHSSLQYEIRLLQKELEIRKREREYNLSAADAAARQQAESHRKIASLEAECHRLRALLRQRLPGLTAVSRMKSELDGPGSPGPPLKAAAARKKASATSPTALAPENVYVRLRAVEEQNRALREALARSNSELQMMQIVFAEEASRVSLAASDGRSLKGTDAGAGDDASSCCDSWASALITELENFHVGEKPRQPSPAAADAVDNADKSENVAAAVQVQVRLPESAKAAVDDLIEQVEKMIRRAEEEEEEMIELDDQLKEFAAVSRDFVNSKTDAGDWAAQLGLLLDWMNGRIRASALQLRRTNEAAAPPCPDPPASDEKPLERSSATIDVERGAQSDAIADDVGPGDGEQGEETASDEPKRQDSEAALAAAVGGVGEAGDGELGQHLPVYVRKQPANHAAVGDHEEATPRPALAEPKTPAKPSLYQMMLFEESIVVETKAATDQKYCNHPAATATPGARSPCWSVAGDGNTRQYVSHPVSPDPALPADLAGRQHKRKGSFLRNLWFVRKSEV